MEEKKVVQMRYDYSVKLDRISGKVTITDQPFQTKYVEVPRDERFRKLYSYILVKMDLEKSCEGEILKDKEGQPIFDKYGQPVIVGAKPPTITGLALALGFATRKSLLEYEGKKEFVNTIARAKSRVEQYAEERLFDRDGANGARRRTLKYQVLLKQRRQNWIPF